MSDVDSSYPEVVCPIHWDPNKFPHATVHLKIDMDGGVTIHTGAADIGQGSDTVVGQAVAEVLGLPMDMIRSDQRSQIRLQLTSAHTPAESHS